MENCEVKMEKSTQKNDPRACKITKGKKDAVFQLIACKILLLQLFRFSEWRFSQIALFLKTEGRE